MKISLGKTLWKIGLRFFDVFIKLFFILDLALFILIALQIKPGVKDFFEGLVVPLLIVFSLVRLIVIFPVWIQGIYLWIYFKFGHQLILKFLSLGAIDYNFVWSLPKGINDFIGVSIGGEFVDFIFWSGFVLSALFLIDRLERRFLVFLAKKMKIGWAEEILEERLEKFSKALKRDAGIIEVEKKEGLKDNEIFLSPFPKEVKEKIVFKPKFFKDRLWHLPFYFLLMTSPVLILPFLAGGVLGVLNLAAKEPLNPVFVVFGGTFLLVFLIFLSCFLWEATTRIILEKDKIIIKTFWFKKRGFFYQDIKHIAIEKNNGGMETLLICYKKQTKGKQILKKVRLFLWPFTTEKVLEELRPRLNNIIISDNLIKETKATRSVGSAIAVAIIIGLFVGFLCYIIHQAANRPKFSDQDCANRLVFWISDKPKVGILETKEGFRPVLSQKSPFYFFINAEKSAPECDKKISFVIYDAKGKVIFKNGGLTSPKEGVANYYWEPILKEKGDYLLKVNYESIPAKKINFTVK